MLRTAVEILRSLVEKSYVVGGVLRDRMLEAPGRADLDLAVKGDGFQVARELTRMMGRYATFVPLDSGRGTARVVLSAHPARSIDISSLRGDGIHQDLEARDFTINALALDTGSFLRGEFDRIVDPMGGQDDLRSRVVRACSPTAFHDDPVRILRAFRFVVTLGFSLAPATKSIIGAQVTLLKTVSPERIRDELFVILSTSHCVRALEEMEELGILTTLFPELDLMKGCTQNWFHHLDVWNHTAAAIGNVEALVDRQEEIFGAFAARVRSYLGEEPVSGRPRVALVKLATLFHDVGKPPSRTVDPGGRIRFFGHEKISAEVFEETGRRLRLATREIRTVRGWIAGHMRPGILTSPEVTRRAIYRLCIAFGEDILGLLLIFVADLEASQGPARNPAADKQATQGVLRVLDLCFAEEAPPRRLLDGRDLISMFGLREGPEIGRILQNLAELQGSGEITTRDQALEAVRHLIEKR